MMNAPFHEGELEVQRRAGVEATAQRVGQSIGAEMPLKAQEFLKLQPFVIVASAADDGEVWASLLSGAPGFATALDADTLLLNAFPTPGDPLETALESQAETRVGVLAIEPETRRRMRLNGVATRLNDGVKIEAREVYANCPKYIQKRVWRAEPSSVAPKSQAFDALTGEHEAWVARADTFFIATSHPERLPDASHRGGETGFVRVENARTLCFPDYAGNAMFNTLGNLAVNPSAGLLFIDWRTGDTLQLSGFAQVLWDEERRASFAGAERVVEFGIERVLHARQTTNLRWEFVEASPFNPKEQR